MFFATLHVKFLCETIHQVRLFLWIVHVKRNNLGA